MLSLKILSPEALLFEGSADAVFLPGTLCPFEVLPGHAAIVSSLDAGAVRWRSGGKEESVQISSGFVRCKDDVLVVCVEQ